MIMSEWAEDSLYLLYMGGTDWSIDGRVFFRVRMCDGVTWLFFLLCACLLRLSMIFRLES